MIELNSARIIRETRQTKYYLGISSAELHFVGSYKDLSDCEKLIWIMIADHCALDPHFSCILTQGQIAVMVNKTTNTVGTAISRLRALGFLRTESVSYGPLSYFLTLPQAGLESLLAAPTRKSTTPPLKTMDPSPENRGSPPLKTMDLLIYNNKINNINHNHDSHSDIPAIPNIEPITSSEADMQDADALVCDFKKIIQEKYQHLPVFKRDQAAFTHFDANKKILICKRQIELAAISERQKIQIEQVQQQRFNEKLAQATPVPESRPKPADCKLLEFEFDNEYFLVEEAVKDQILNQIPRLHSQRKITGEASKKPLNTLIKEILYYVTKAGSMALDSCQRKKFFIAKKLCEKGVWERPNGLERQASIHREQQWQKAKKQENRTSTAFAQELGLKIA
jgi:hypothetical protein